MVHFSITSQTCYLRPNGGDGVTSLALQPRKVESGISFRWAKSLMALAQVVSKKTNMHILYAHTHTHM